MSDEGLNLEMSFKDKELWEKGLGNNQDPYGKAIYAYAELWACTMEHEMEKNKASVKDVAEQASKDADTDGITGFMYGAAVSVLSDTWEHGEELRKWHNGEYNHEGDGVVNPAIITVGKNDDE
jgi:hypothetical protein